MLRAGAKRFVAVVGLFLLVATACAEETGVAAKQAKPGAKPGGTLTVGITPPLTLEPSSADTNEASGNLVIRTICDPLIALDPVSGEPKPAILESWTTSDGGSTWFFKLRRNVRFHNGREVNAEDVVFGLSRVAQREYGSPVARLLEDVNGYEFVHGDIDIEDADIDERFREQLSGTRVVENYAFEVRLRDEQEQTDYFRLMTHPLASPVPKKEVLEDPDAYSRRPICTGPYRLTQDWAPTDTSIVVERFEGHYGRNLGYTRGGRGWFDRIEFKVFPDRAAQIPEFQNGGLLLAQGTPSLVQAGAPVAAAHQLQATTGTFEFIGLPANVEPFNNRNVRIALSQAIDRNALAQSVYGGFKTPATGILPPTVGRIYREDACRNRAPAGGNVEAARATLRRSEVDLTTKTHKLYFNDELNHRQLMTEVAAQWTAAFGAQFELVPMGWDQYLTLGSGQPGFDGPFRFGWRPQFPSADNYIYPLFHSSGIGQENLMRFSNRELDNHLHRTARTAPTDQDIRAEYQTAEDMVCEQMPVVPLFFRNTVHFVNTDLLDTAGEVFVEKATALPDLRDLYAKT